MNQSKCSKCLTVKPLDEFPSRKFKRRGVCRQCINSYRREWRKANSELAKKYDRDYYHQNQNSKSAEALERYWRDVESNRERMRQYYWNNHDRQKERAAIARAERRRKVLDGYGNQCKCCGEIDNRFLTLDHVNNDGSTHRQQLGGDGGARVYQWAIKNDFPATLQLLCFNCNFGRQVNGGTCPHEEILKKGLRLVS